MGKKIKILLLEDQESDAVLAQREIKKNIENVEIKWVDNRESYIQALDEFNPHIIVSDYNLPTFDGISALKIKKVAKPDIPFIICTSSMNEDTAVECMKAGASDYIIKEHLRRLSTAILNALEQKAVNEAKKEAENELRISEAKFYRLAENFPDIIYRYGLNPAYSIEYMNPAVTKIVGYLPEEFYADSNLALSCIHPDDKRSFSNMIGNSFNFYEAHSFRWIAKDGSIKWIEQRNIPVYNNSGDLVAVEGVARDITEKKNLEDLNQALFKIAEATNKTKSLSELYVEVHRIVNELMPAKNFYIAIFDKLSNTIDFPYFVDEKDSTPPKRAFGKGLTEYVISKGEPLLCDSKCGIKLQEENNIDQIGSSHSSWLGVPLKYDKKIIGVMAAQSYSQKETYSEKEKTTLMFVSNQVAKAIIYKQVASQILKLSQAVEQSPLSVVITNVSNEIEYVNNTYTAISGYSFEESFGKNPGFIRSGQTSEKTIQDLWTRITAGYSWKGELINRKKNGSTYYENVNITPIIDDEGITTNYLAIKEDITEKKRIENELIKAKERAEESDKLKTAFIQNISHEIRTPMNAIMGFSELMEIYFDNSEKLKYYIEVIQQRSEDLLDIINELLDISRIESGIINVKTEIIDINQMLNDLYAQINDGNKKYTKPNVALVMIPVPTQFPSKLEMDPGKLKQIFNNLINNAFKFTSSGHISFGYHTITGDQITFFVADTGKGIPSEMKGLIFERFRKTSDETLFAQDGLGLGLAIVKGLLNILSGKIWVESELNKGSTFYFSIPFKPVKLDSLKNDDDEKVNYNWSRYTILIVEDDNFNLAYILELLQETRVKCLTSVDGTHAIDLFKNENKIDLVLMDIRLPDTSGFELSKEFVRLRPEIPIIAQTAYAADSDRQKSLDAGCVDFIAKPLKRIDFLKCIKQHLIN